MSGKDPRDEVVAGPITEDFLAPQLRVDTDDVAHTLTIYVLRNGTNEAVSRLTFGWTQARILAYWILESTTPEQLPL
jgi:hypothetical protein